MDIEKMTKLSDFAKERDVPNNTIVKYITRHMEDFKEHIDYDAVNNNAMYLDDEAVSMLSKKYRLTTQIITDNDLYERMMKLTEIVVQMHEERNERLMIEEKNVTLENKVIELTEELKKANAEREIAQLEAEKLRLERNNMIDMNYLQLVHHISKLKREKL